MNDLLAQRFGHLDTPENESLEHFILKQVALIWLRDRGSRWVGTEIWGLGGNTEADMKTRAKHLPPERRQGFWGQGLRREIADAVGVSKDKGVYTLRSVEAKVSRADFQAGYCTGAHLAYVITPTGLVRPDELEKNVGLLEVDLAKLKPHVSVKWIADQVKVVKRPRRQKISPNLAPRIIQRIAASHSNQAVYKNPWLVIDERKAGSR